MRMGKSSSFKQAIVVSGVALSSIAACGDQGSVQDERLEEIGQVSDWATGEHDNTKASSAPVRDAGMAGSTAPVASAATGGARDAGASVRDLPAAQTSAAGGGPMADDASADAGDTSGATERPADGGTAGASAAVLATAGSQQPGQAGNQHASGGDESDAAVSGEPAAATGAAGASSQADRPVTIRFKGKIGDAEFACGTEYEGQGSANTKVTPQDFRMFVQDLSLVQKDGRLVPLKLEVRGPWQSSAVALLDFEDGTGACVEGTPEMNTEISGVVPAGDYAGISFRVGVPDALNHADPTTQQDPLRSSSSLSWGWLAGYRFTKIELAGASAGVSPGGGTLHVGSMACQGDAQEGTIECNTPNRNLIALSPFDAASNTVLVDIGALFKNTNLTQTAVCMSFGPYCEPMFEAFGIDFATGKEQAEQTVFRVE